MNIISIDDPHSLQRAANILLNEGIICFPTETVYALAGDPRSDNVVSRIYDIKSRDARNPLSIFLPAYHHIESFATTTPLSKTLAKAFWPGPLTLVLPLKQPSILSSRVTAFQNTVGIRIPDHAFSQQLLHKVNIPLIATSANISGQPSAISASEIIKTIGSSIDLIVDGGVSTLGVGSTVVDLTTDKPYYIRREGPITPLEIENILSHSL